MTFWALGPLAPDKAKSRADGFLTVASGAYPLENGYRPIGQFAALYTALPAAPKGGASFTSAQGINYIIAGDNTSLYKAESGGWTSLASGYSLFEENRWRFAQFGGIAVATNGTDPMQKIDLVTGNVSPLGGTPPKFETLAVVKDFLVGGILDGNVTYMGWSGINDSEWWTFGQRQSDFNILPTGGRINGILSGEFGIILQRDRICRMDYVGGNVIFEINEVSSNIGCVTVHSVAQWGTLGFFLSDEGWMMWDGQQPVPIGREWIDREFADLYDVSDWSQMSTAIDPINGHLLVAMPDKMWGYSWIFKKWFNIPVVSPIIFSGVTKSISIDEDYAPDMPEDADIDGAGLPSLDDLEFRGGDPLLYIFSSTYTLGALTGAPMAATFTGTDLELFQGRRTRLRYSRPETDAVASVSIGFLERNRLGDSGATSSFNSLQASGEIPTRVHARYLRPTLTLSSTWDYATGVEFIGTAGFGR